MSPSLFQKINVFLGISIRLTMMRLNMKHLSLRFYLDQLEKKSLDVGSGFDSTSPPTDSMTVDRNIAFWIYLFLFIASILCSLLIFSQFLLKPPLRRKINNQVMLAVLITSFIQVRSLLFISRVTIAHFSVRLSLFR